MGQCNHGLPCPEAGPVGSSNAVALSSKGTASHQCITWPWRGEPSWSRRLLKPSKAASGSRLLQWLPGTRLRESCREILAAGRQEAAVSSSGCKAQCPIRQGAPGVAGSWRAELAL